MMQTMTAGKDPAAKTIPMLFPNKHKRRFLYFMQKTTGDHPL
jgi:hypothetical protein